MKTLLYICLFLVSFMGYSQFEADEKIIISEMQNDDVYLAGNEININAQIHGDAVIAGRTIVVQDSIRQDLIVAGGDIKVQGHVHDDVRAAGGNLIIDATVGDDVIIFGGEVYITENAVIHGNLIAFSGDIILDGRVMGFVKISGGNIKINGKISEGTELRADEIEINGEIGGKTKMVAEKIKIGDNAQFYNDVDYWCDSSSVDFKNSLVNGISTYNKDLAEDRLDFPWSFFGIATIAVLILYILSSFLILFIFNLLIRKFLSNTISLIETNVFKSLGYGLIYLLGLPLVILICFLILIGIPIGLFLGFFYIFSILFGHLVAALIITQYLNKNNQKPWGIWMLSLVALGILILIRLITLVPFIGAFISLIVIATAYGLIILTIINNRTEYKLSSI